MGIKKNMSVIGHIILMTITGMTQGHLNIPLKSMYLILRSAADRCHPPVPDLKISWNTGILVLILATR